MGFAIQVTQAWSGALTALIFGAIAGAFLGAAFGVWVDVIVAHLAYLLKQNGSREIAHDRFVLTLTLLSIVLGIGLGMGFTVGFLNAYTLLALGGSGLPLVILLLYTPLVQRRLIASYRKSEQNLIQP